MRALFAFPMLLVATSASAVEAAAPLRVAISGSYMPLHGTSGAEVIGLEADLARLIAKELGQPLEIIDTRKAFKLGAVEAVATGKVDLGLSSITPTEERRKSVDFTRPYLALEYGLAGAVEHHEKLVESKSRVAAPPGARSAVAAAMPKARIVDCPSLAECMQRVVRGDADFFADELVALELAVQGGPLEVSDLAFGSSPLAIATAKGQAARIDAVLEKRKGEIAAIVSKWKPGQRWFPAETEALLGTLPKRAYGLDEHEGDLVRSSSCNGGETSLSVERSARGWELGLVHGQDGDAFRIDSATAVAGGGVRIEAAYRYGERKPVVLVLRPLAGKGRWSCAHPDGSVRPYVDERHASSVRQIFSDDDQRDAKGNCVGEP